MELILFIVVVAIIVMVVIPFLIPAILILLGIILVLRILGYIGIIRTGNRQSPSDEPQHRSNSSSSNHPDVIDVEYTEKEVKDEE